jgi:hypothetical protein
MEATEEPLREYCMRCEGTTKTNVVHHASGTEFVCAACGGQVDFLHNEEEE